MRGFKHVKSVRALLIIIIITIIVIIKFLPIHIVQIIIFSNCTSTNNNT